MGGPSLKLLLDTHVWVWSVADPDRLHASIRERIESGHDPLHLSSVSVWEVLLLHERGRIDLGDDPHRWLDHALDEYPLHDVPVDRGIAAASRDPDLPGRDPADRFLAATARRRGMTLLTHDRQMLASPAVPTIGPG